MSARLERLEDLAKLARKAKYSVKVLARLKGCSTRQLERSFICVLKQTPSEWLRQLRLRDGLGTLLQGGTVTEAANAAHYNHSQKFSNAFSQRYGYQPSHARRR